MQVKKSTFAEKSENKRKGMETVKKLHVESMEQAVVLAEEWLKGKNPTQVLAQQIYEQQKTEERIVALEGIFLNQKEIFNFDEAAAYLNMSKSTLYKLTSSKSIPHYKPIRFVFFEKADLDKWIRGHRVTSVDEMHATAQDFSMKQPMPTV